MFSCDTVGEWVRLPCFIWSLLGLTDPCCMSTTYVVTTYADGHTESDLWLLIWKEIKIQIQIM